MPDRDRTWFQDCYDAPGGKHPSVHRPAEVWSCLDIEAFDWTHHYLRGVEVNDETLPVDLIRENGIGGHVLESGHTASRFRVRRGRRDCAAKYGTLAVEPTNR